MDGKETEKEKNRRIIGPYFDYELADRNRMLKDKMCQPIMDMLEESEKRAKKQVWRESVEAIMSQGYTQTEALQLLKIPEDEYRDIMVADGHNTEK